MIILLVLSQRCNLVADTHQLPQASSMLTKACQFIPPTAMDNSMTHVARGWRQFLDDEGIDAIDWPIEHL